MPDIAVVDDHLLVAETLRIAFTARGLDTRAILARPLPELVETLLVAAPRLVLLDLDLGAHGDSTALVAPLTAAGMRVLIVTGVVDRLRIAATLEQGAVGYHLKSDGFDALIGTAQRALDGATVLDPADHVQLLGELFRPRQTKAGALAPFHLLTEREQATLRELAAGRSVQEIARRWVVSTATVRSHVRGVLTKLGEPTQLAAVATARRSGWLGTELMAG